MATVRTALRAAGFRRGNTVIVRDYATSILPNGEIAVPIGAIASLAGDGIRSDPLATPRPSFLWRRLTVDGADRAEGAWLSLPATNVVSGFVTGNESGTIVVYSGAVILRGLPPAIGRYRLVLRVELVPAPDVILTAPTFLETAVHLVVNPPSTPAVTLPRLTWFQARELAVMRAVPIRREGWLNRYLRYDDALWWMHYFNPATKVEISRAPVIATEWDEQAFRAGDWVSHTAVDAAALAEVQAIKTLFP